VVVVVDPRPAELLGRPAAPTHPVELAGEVIGQPEQERLRRGDTVPSERENRVLLRVSGDHVGVVALGVRGLEISAQLRGDVEVDEVVPISVAGHADHAVLGLAVLVGGEGDVNHAGLPCLVGADGRGDQLPRYVV
jgi:hypothetical protein